MYCYLRSLLNIRDKNEVTRIIYPYKYPNHIREVQDRKSDRESDRIRINKLIILINQPLIEKLCKRLIYV
jgi:hypothetical protein